MNPVRRGAGVGLTLIPLSSLIFLLSFIVLSTPLRLLFLILLVAAAALSAAAGAGGKAKIALVISLVLLVVFLLYALLFMPKLTGFAGAAAVRTFLGNLLCELGALICIPLLCGSCSPEGGKGYQKGFVVTAVLLLVVSVLELALNFTAGTSALFMAAVMLLGAAKFISMGLLVIHMIIGFSFLNFWKKNRQA